MQATIHHRWMSPAAAAVLSVAACVPSGDGERREPVDLRPGPDASFSCHPVGSLPDPACTPGLAETTDLSIICGTRTSERRRVSEDTKRDIYASYGISYPQPTGSIEVDHLIPLCLGGSNDPSNLWPQWAPEYHAKDRLEIGLQNLVCANLMSIEEAQKEIRKDWVGAYRKRFGREP